MSSKINLKVAEANTAELRRLAASVDAHPFSRFVYLAFREQRAPRR
jgi:hypothetical protein